MEKQREVTMKFVFDDKVIQEEQNFELCFFKNCIRNTKKTDVPREIDNYVLFGETVKRNNGFLP